ncbi:unnamed protein product [Toxocara canis]|uniref:Transmembrane protein n=1 Tax=Toxocara canis TaxID=6265 RepID=A0A183UEB5_TOXCA|nr:unnamed protein product [Toxocara canis]
MPANTIPTSFFSQHREEQRPVLTIVILVSGVVGGLVVVITVVYFYRFCLKKRPPVTTTGKPEHKRDQIRSQAASQCRPLPLPPLVANQPASSVPSHYHNFLPQFEPIPLPSPDKMYAFSLLTDHGIQRVSRISASAKRVRVGWRRSWGEGDGKGNLLEIMRILITSVKDVHRLKHHAMSVVWTVRILGKLIVATSANENSEPSVYKNERNKQTKGNNYLSVDGAPPRPQSAEMLLTAAEDEERRRASLDAYHRPVRRQLPNIEHLEKVSSFESY